MLSNLRLLPHCLRRALELDAKKRSWARELASSRSILFIGRGSLYPIALEGTLKLKEISYLHAEGCAGGELKHGMLALVNEQTPVVGLAQDDQSGVKMATSLAEIKARKGKVYALTREQLEMPEINVLRMDRESSQNAWLAPLAYTIPLQLLAYHTARIIETDIDKPRNLAKSVTVE